MELTKSQKKIARELIDKGIERDKTKYIFEIDNIIQQFKNNELDYGQAYASIFEKVKENDKKIALKYDGLSGSRYYITVLSLYIDDIISDEEIAQFSEDLYQDLMQNKKRLLD